MCVCFEHLHSVNRKGCFFSSRYSMRRTKPVLEHLLMFVFFCSFRTKKRKKNVLMRLASLQVTLFKPGTVFSFWHWIFSFFFNIYGSLKRLLILVKTLVAYEKKAFRSNHITLSLSLAISNRERDSEMISHLRWSISSSN